MPGGIAKLQKSLQARFKCEDLPPIMWHSWRKLGAALWDLSRRNRPWCPDVARHSLAPHAYGDKPRSGPRRGVEVGHTSKILPRESFHNQAKAPGELPPAFKPLLEARD